MVRLWLFGVVGFLLLGTPQPAGAEPNSVGIWRITKGPLKKKKHRAFVREVVRALSEQSDVRLPRRTRKINRALRRVEKNCRDISVECATRVGEALAVEYVVAGMVGGTRKVPQVILVVVDVAKNERVAKVSETFGAAELPDNVEDMINRLHAEWQKAVAPAPAPPAAPVESEPPPAPAYAAVPPEPPEPVDPDAATVGEEASDPVGPLATAAAPPPPPPPIEVPLAAPSHESAASPSDLAPATGEPSLEPIASGPELEPITDELALAPIEEEPSLEPIVSTPEVIEAVAAKDKGEKGPAITAQTQRAAERGIGLSISGGPVFLKPMAKLDTTGGFSIAVSYSLPIFASPALWHVLGISVESGWYPLQGVKSESFSEFDLAPNLDDPGQGSAFVTTDFDVTWNIQVVPIMLGMASRVSLDTLLAPLGLESLPLAPGFYGRFGFALAFGVATATLNQPDAPPFVNANQSQDVALGIYAVVGGGVTLGPGALNIEYRYANTRLNFKHPQWNPSLGDLGGNTWRLCYRFDL